MDSKEHRLSLPEGIFHAGFQRGEVPLFGASFKALVSQFKLMGFHVEGMALHRWTPKRALNAELAERPSRVA